MAPDMDCPPDSIDPSDLRTLAKAIIWDVAGAPAIYTKAYLMAERMECGETIAVDRDVIEGLLMLARCGNDSCAMRGMDTTRPPCQCEVCAAYRRIDAWTERHPPLDPSDVDRLCDSITASGSREIIAPARQIADALRAGDVLDTGVDATVIRRLAEIAECKRLSMPCVSAAALIGECWCKTCFSYGRVMRWLKGTETMP